MKIYVNAKPNSKENRVQKNDDTHFSVRITAPAAGGKANLALTEVLADYFQTSKNKVILLSGHTSKQKVFEIVDK